MTAFHLYYFPKPTNKAFFYFRALALYAQLAA